MIKRITYREKIVPLWQSAFGDTVEEIEFFLDNARDYKCVGCFNGEELASMLFLVSCELNSKKAEYIYAACTDEKYKKRGFMTELLNYCKNNYKTLCLIPASDTLKEFYNARGIYKRAEISDIVFNQTDEIEEYLLDGYELTEPCALYFER